MAIHPSRFSGKTADKKPILKTKPKSGSKFVTYLILMALLLVVVLVGLLGWREWKSLPNLPNQVDYPISSNIEQRTNILLARFDGDQLGYLALASLASDDQPKILVINTSLVAPLPLGQGNYQLGQAYQMGNQAGNRGINLLRDGVSRLLAVPIDGFIGVKAGSWSAVSRDWGSTEGAIISSLSSPILPFHLLTYSNSAPIYGSFSNWQIWQLSQQLGKSGQAQDLSLISAIIPGGNFTSGFTLDTAAFDDQLGQQFQESSVLKARPRVAVVNASGIPGLATELARYVKNLGGSVITVESADQEQPQTVIHDHLGGTELSHRLATIFRAQVISDHKTSRADIEIIFGQDAKKWF